MAQFSVCPEITVILATHNGNDRLYRTLDSMTHLQAPLNGWSLIIIDNASTDETRSVIQKFNDALPLTILFNPIRGKNRSLNLALKLVTSELIAFTDDDVLFPRNWLVGYLNVAAARPEFSVFGGRIEPDWPSPPPTDLLKGVSLGNAFAIHDDDISDGEVSAGKIWGPNMAVRLQVFKDGNKFDEKIGPAGKNYVPGSESMLNLALERKGYKFWFSNDVVVKHQIRAEQLTREWLQGRAFRLGRGQVRWGRPEDSGSRFGQAMPRWFVRYLVENWLRLIWARCRSRPTDEMRAMWHYHVARGMISEHWSLRGR